jgi:hypothetical protein
MSSGRWTGWSPLAGSALRAWGGTGYAAGWYLRDHKPRTAGFEFDDRVLAMARTGSTASV